jgi:hypothetical protein
MWKEAIWPASNLGVPERIEENFEEGGKVEI